MFSQVGLSGLVNSLPQIEPAWVQAISTVVLVLVTLYYSRILRKEVIRDRKQDHTNVLRNTVTKWLENLPSEDLSYLQLDGIILSGGFQSVPKAISDGPYVNDFQNNHAPTVRKLSDQINTNMEEINHWQEQFFNQYEEQAENSIPDDTKLEEDIEWVEIVLYILVATERLQQKNSQPVSIADGIEVVLSPTTVGSLNEAQIAWNYSSYSTDSHYVFSSEFDENNYHDVMPIDQMAHNAAADTIAQIAELMSDSFENKIVEISEIGLILQDVDEDMVKLRQHLERYRRQNIYSGYCPYITDSTFWLLYDKMVGRRVRSLFR